MDNSNPKTQPGHVNAIVHVGRQPGWHDGKGSTEQSKVPFHIDVRPVIRANGASLALLQVFQLRQFLTLSLASPPNLFFQSFSKSIPNVVLPSAVPVFSEGLQSNDRTSVHSVQKTFQGP